MEENNFTTIECAGGVVVSKDCVALIEMKKVDGWGFPKGRINDGETPLAAARREIFEETGIADVLLVRPLGAYQRQAADGKPLWLNIHMFLFEVSEQVKLKPILDDVRDAKWAFVKEVGDMLALEDDKHFFNSIDFY
ncbi:NUDIX domain-containing protein [Candidatus Falkowbacteria bacterium]|nr:NUDIX domain-containing protein [Candidatus Falkowbacteria bacterium]